MPPRTSHSAHPPFPSHLPSAPLLTIPLKTLESSEAVASKTFFTACQNLGFFYLDLHGSELGETLIAEAEDILKVQRSFFALTDADKEMFARGKVDDFFGYRSTECGDCLEGEHGRKGRVETYNLGKDDLLSQKDPPTAMHPMIHARRSLFASYTIHARRIIDLLIVHLEQHLHLPADTLKSLHRLAEPSGDHVRFNRIPLHLPHTEARARAGEHTDFGSLTLLFNWLGGLQVRLPEGQSEGGDWAWVKPVPGCCVVNLGDAMVKFSAGLVRSNVHRVVPAPEEQRIGGAPGKGRESLVYFSRPEDRVILGRVRGGLVGEVPMKDGEVYVGDPGGMTAKEWTFQRSVGDLKGVFTHKGGLEIREGREGEEVNG